MVSDGAWPSCFIFADEALFQSSAQNHKDVYDAIVAKDAKAAVEALQRDISEGYNF